MHVSGLGSNPRVCEMYSRLESLEAEVTFAKYLDLLLRLLFIISSRWSTGKCFWFITNSLTHKTKTKFSPRPWVVVGTGRRGSETMVELASYC